MNCNAFENFSAGGKFNSTNTLYDSSFEHDNCGIGACVNIKGVKSRDTVENALKIVENLEHRAGKDAEGKTGDGVGILTQVPHKFFKKVTKALGIKIGGEVYITRGENKDVPRSASNPKECTLSVNGMFFSDKNGQPFSIMLSTADLQD